MKFIGDIDMSKNSGKQIIKEGSKKTTIKIGSVVLIGILAVLLFGINKSFNSPEKKIIGAWESEEGELYVFNKNGQFSVKAGWSETGTYMIDGNLLTYTTVFGSTRTCHFSVTSNSLILFDDDWETVLERKK